jgi:hypothetical protein
VWWPALRGNRKKDAVMNGHATKEIDQLIGGNISAKRGAGTHKEIPQKEVSDSAGLSLDRFKRIERGCEHPSIGDLRMIACALHISVESLLPKNIKVEAYQ